MALHLSPWNLATSAALILSFAILFVMKKWKKLEPGRTNLPPGPKKLPIIGNLHLLSQPPFRSLRDLAKEHGPIMHLKLGEVDSIVVSSPEIAAEMLKDNDPVFTNRPESIAIKIFWYNYKSITFSPYGDYLNQMRKICAMEFLSGKNVRSFDSIREDEVDRLLQSIRLSDGKPVNLTQYLLRSMGSIICRAAFGNTCKDKNLFFELTNEGARIAAGFSMADLFPSSAIANALFWWTKLKLSIMRRRIDVILDDIINEHKKHERSREFGNEDLVDALLRVKENGGLQFPIGYDNIKAVLLDMFTGGTETTSSTIVWAMTELLRNPRVMAKVQTEVRQLMKGGSKTKMKEDDIQKLNYLKLVIMETHRLHPQICIIPRVSREPSRISGYTIPEKIKVMVNIWAIHRDPKYWAHPETFEPERFQSQPSLDSAGTDFRYLPFGNGKRICPGMAFGSASIALTLAQFLYNFDWKLPKGVDAQALDMIENSGLSSSRKEDLFVVATPYQPSP